MLEGLDLVLEIRQLALALVEEFGQLFEGGLIAAGEIVGEPGTLLDQLHCATTGDGLDPPNTGGDSTFAGDGAKTDVAGPLDMAAAAELSGELTVTNGHNSDIVTVLLTEKRHGAERPRVVDGHDCFVEGPIANDLGVDQAFDLLQLVEAHGSIP